VIFDHARPIYSPRFGLLIVPGIPAHAPGRCPEGHTLDPIMDDPSRPIPTLGARSESPVGAIECRLFRRRRCRRAPRRTPSACIAGALRPIRVSMRAHGLARLAKRRTFHVVFGNRTDPMAEGFSPSDASLSSFRRDHEGPWVPPTREAVIPCACLLTSIRPHGRTLPGRAVDPCGCLPATMRPHGCPRARDGYLLPAA
jgi:hypothetical protein